MALSTLAVTVTVPESPGCNVPRAQVTVSTPSYTNDPVADAKSRLESRTSVIVTFVASSVAKGL